MLRNQVVLPLLGTLALLWSIVGWNNYQAESHAIEAIQRESKIMALLFADQANNTFRSVDHALLELRQTWLEAPTNLAAEIGKFQNLLDQSTFQVAIIDARGFLAYSSLGMPKEPSFLGDREHFTVHQSSHDDKLFVSRPVKGRVSGKWSIQLTRPIFDQTRFAGVIVISVDPGYFVRSYEKADIGKNGMVSLIRDTGEIMARSSEQQAYIGQVLKTLNYTAPGAPAQGSFRSIEQTDGVDRLFGYARLTQYGVTVVVAPSVDESLAPVRSQQRRVLLFAGVVTLLMTLMAWLLLRSLARKEKSEQALFEQQQRLSLATLHNGIGIWDWDSDRGIPQWDDSLYALYHMRREDFPDTAQARRKALHPDDIDRVDHERKAAFSSQTAFNSEFRVRWPTGETRYIQSIAKVFRDDKSGTLRMLGSNMDITDQRQAQEHLRLLQTSIAHLNDMLVITEAKPSKGAGRLIVFVNEAFERITGYRREEVLGKSAQFLQGPNTDRAEIERMRATLKKGQRVQAELINYTRSGQEFWVGIDMAPIADDQGAITHWVSISRDITDRKQTEKVMLDLNANLEARVAERTRELVAAKEQAEAANAAKSTFLANMSHEIRTPLNGVIGIARIGYRTSDETGPTRKTFARIIESGNLLLRVVNDILDFSRLDAGKLKLDPQPVRLADCLERVIDLVRESAQSKGLALDLDRASDLPVACLIDALRLEQILLNLLSNAIKFTEAGSVTLAASRDGQWLVLRVTDTGIGMDAEQMARVFQPFEQADGSTTRRFGGTGLGLSITQRLVDLMKGRISVSSVPGQGSTLEFTLPLVEVDEAQLSDAHGVTAAPEDSGTRLAGVRILVAEDNQVNQLVIDDILASEGCQFVIVSDGQEAVDRIIAAGPNAFDLVLMDIQMPRLNGYEAARRILALQPALPIVALTAHTLAEERQKCLDAGMIDMLTKPINPNALVHAVLRHTGKAAPDSQVAPAVQAVVKAPSTAGIDLPALEASYSQKPGMVKRLLGTFIESSAATADELRSAAGSNNLAQIGFLAHSIKSVLGFLKAEQATELALQTQLAARAGEPQSPELARRLADDIDALIDEARILVKTQ